MAEKLSIRERARIALGDFGFTLDTLHEKMSEIFKEEAKARGLDDTTISIAAAVIARDGSLKALGKAEIEDIFLPTDAERIEKAAHDFGETYAAMRGGASGWGGEDHAGMKQITKVMEDIKRDVSAAGKKNAKPKTTITPEKKAHFEGLIAAEKKRAAQAKKAAKEAEKPKEEKRKRGRPRKNGKGSQTTIWVTDEMREAVNQYAQFYRVSFSDAVSKLLEMAIRGRA